MLLLLVLQLLSWWAVSVTAVPVARIATASAARCCYDDRGNQLSNSPPSPELSSGDGGEMVSFFYFADRAQRAF